MEDRNINSPVNENKNIEITETAEERTIEQSYVEFHSYAILIFWLLPGFFGVILFTLFTQAGGIWFWWTVLIGLQAMIRRRSIPGLNSLFHFGSKLFFGARFTKNNKHIPRVWWFLTFGSLISFLLLFLLSLASLFVIPLILVIYKRRQVLRLFYILSFLPRREFLVYQDPQVIKEREQLLGQYDQSAREYMIFIEPSFFTHLTTILLILILPLIFALGLAIISLSIDTGISGVNIADQELVSKLTAQGIVVGIVGIVAVIPYIILFIPSWGKRKLSYLVSHRVTEKILQIVTGSGINTLPLFQGEYFIEKESQVLDMSTPTGMFSIFGNGRLTTIIIIPLALISWIFRLTVLDIIEDSGTTEKLSVGEFFTVFTDNLAGNQLLLLSLLFLIPILLTIILPVIFVLSDAEIKRSKWRFLDETNTVQGEILEVEDIGKTLSNLVKIVLGLGAISSISNTISILVVATNPINGWIITSVILILGASLIFPGVLFMLYVYFGSGEHTHAVNSTRYLASQSDKIGVGTVDKNYMYGEKLSYPPIKGLTQISTD